jgi:hypothetical protein
VVALALALVGCSDPDEATVDPAAAVPPACDFRPAPDNTGPQSEVTSSPVTVLGEGESLENASVTSLRIEGSDVTVRDVHVNGEVLVTGDRVTLERVSAGGIAISSATNVRVERSDIGRGPADGIHVTSDGPDLVRKVVLSHNLVREPRAGPDAHYDGTQVRGVRGLLIECSVYDAGDYQDTYNAAIYVENANGGARGVRIEHNWLLGSAWSLMIGTPGISLVGNRVGGDIKWGTCYLGDVVEGGAPVEEDNVLLDTGEVVDLCAEEPGETS